MFLPCQTRSAIWATCLFFQIKQCLAVELDKLIWPVVLDPAVQKHRGAFEMLMPRHGPGP